MKNEIVISVIIPTYNRVQELGSVLDSIADEVNNSVEILIVEQRYNNSKLITNLLKRKKVKYKYIFIRNPTLTGARNRGIYEAKGEIIIFIDDDVIVKKGFIDNHLRNYKDVNVGGVAGRVITKNQKIDEENRKVGKVNFLGRFSDGFSSKIRQEVDTVIGCNSSWRKDILLSLGGFDEQFTGNALREDSDLSLRVKKSGYMIVFDPRATVVHLRADTGGSRKSENRVKWYLDFFSNETYFFLKHRSKFVLPIMLISRCEWFIRCFLGVRRGVTLYESLVTPFKGIIEGIRKYKKYDNRN